MSGSLRPSADFSDLKTRILSALAMAAIALGALWMGGDIFGLLLIVCAGLMGWETSRMHCVNPLVPLMFGMLIAASVLSVVFLPSIWWISCVLISIVVGIVGHQSRPFVVVLMGAGIVVACMTLFQLRSLSGFGAVIWLLVVVIASDVGGYFAGRIFGGPKLWPAVSPKKTWSGTIGGWILAALVGFVAVQAGVGSLGLILASVLIAIAAQAGDLAESAMKRAANVKDSSALIPGHGGLLDRFDGVLGAACLMALIQWMGQLSVLGLS